MWFPTGIGWAQKKKTDFGQKLDPIQRVLVHPSKETMLSGRSATVRGNQMITAETEAAHWQLTVTMSLMPKFGFFWLKP